MARGQPDFGMYAPKTVTAAISDMGEVAARLGSVVVYDKRGDVVDFDNFEDPALKWIKYPFIGAGSISHSSTHAKSGAQSVKVTTAAVLNDYMYIQKMMSVLGSLQLGMEISFANPLTDVYLEMLLSYYDGTNVHIAEEKINFNGGLIYVVDDSSTDILVATLGNFGNLEHFFHTTKFVADFATDKYVRLLISNHEYDISATSFRSSADATAPSIEIKVGTYNRLDNARSLYLDDFILTQNEP